MPEIIILAMVFLFVALRLWSVLGRRTGHEQPAAKPTDGAGRPSPVLTREADPAKPVGPMADPVVESDALPGVQAIVAADRNFDPSLFVEGAKSAYRMILEAFWRGDEEALALLVDGNVRDAFAEAIAARREAGEVLDNRLVGIERAVIDQARLEGQMAIVSVRFDADIAAVTRNSEGEVVAGSLSDAISTHDLWTFSRHVGSPDPNWVLIETDEVA